MKNPLSIEVKATQNPALGAALLWRFAVGYNASHRAKEFQPLLISFIVLPIVFQKDLLDVLASTRTGSGIRKFIEKLSDTSEARQDLLYGLHNRVEKWRDISLDSLRVALASRLLRLEPSGHLIPLTVTAPSGIPNSTKRMLASAEKLGEWCSQLSLHEIATLLHIRF